MFLHNVNWKLSTARKIAEGSYASVSHFINVDTKPRIFKLINLNEEVTNLSESTPEIVCSRLLSDLLDGTKYLALNFPKVHKIVLFKGKMPDKLVKEFTEFSRQNEEAERDMQHALSPEEDFHLIIEMDFGGIPLSTAHIMNPWAAISIFCQIVSALAVAESAHGFEHRDLHIKNILIKEFSGEFLTYAVKDHYMWHLEPKGHLVNIIDFNLSRINDGMISHFTRIQCEDIDVNLESAEPEFWLKHENIYNTMQSCLKEDWSASKPVTNIYWLKHVISVFISCSEQLPQVPEREFPLNLMYRWNRALLGFNSAQNFVDEEIIHCPLVRCSRFRD